MATRFYLRSTANTTNITPTPDATWLDTSILTRSWARTNKSGDTIATTSFTGTVSTDRDILFHQYISLPLTPGQTITGAQALSFVVRASETSTSNNLFTSLGIRVLNGTTVQKTVLAVTRDGVEVATTLTNRNLTATSAAGNYTTVSGDHLVIEIGYGGDPSGTAVHSGSLSLGDSSASDLTANDTGTSADNPWVELADTLTFQTFTASGGATSGGEATITRTVIKTFSASGGITSGGAATTSYAPAFTIKTYTASGGITSGGTATTSVLHIKSYSASGGITSGGTATNSVSHVKSYSASGGATSSGAATTSTATSTITLTLKQDTTTIATWSTQRIASSAITNYTFTLTSAQLASITYPANNLTIEVAGATGSSALRVYEISLETPVGTGTTINNYTYNGSGGATSGGAAATAVTHTFAYSGSGSATSGGTATTVYQRNYVYAATGGAVSGGAATAIYQHNYTYSSSGGGTSGGSATTAVQHIYAYTGSGGGVSGGAATTLTAHDYVYVSSGGATAGGAATTVIVGIRTYIASGGGVSGGAASIAIGKIYTGSGGGVAGGSAQYEKYITYILGTVAFVLYQLNAKSTVSSAQLNARVKITQEKLNANTAAGGSYVNINS